MSQCRVDVKIIIKLTNSFTVEFILIENIQRSSRLMRVKQSGGLGQFDHAYRSCS